jgi:hypothetical protein
VVSLATKPLLVVSTYNEDLCLPLGKHAIHNKLDTASPAVDYVCVPMVVVSLEFFL